VPEICGALEICGAGNLVALKIFGADNSLRGKFVASKIFGAGDFLAREILWGMKLLAW
jgi:hypothetical protein